MDDKGVAKFVDVIRDLVKNEVDKTDSTIVCKVVAKNKVSTYDYTYDVYVEPDEMNIISGIQNASNSDIEVGDYVYLYKIKNQLNNSFIFKKIGGSGSSSYVSILEDKISTLVTKDDFSTSITQTAEEIKLRASKAEVSSELTQRAEEIYAQVVKKNDSSSAGFGWSITVDNGFIVYRKENDKTQNVIQADKNGLIIQGQVKAESGYIGTSSNGFEITDQAIYNGNITKWSEAAGGDISGVYIGTDGIKLGDKFSVSPDGTVVATTLKTIKNVEIKYGYSANGVDPSTVTNWQYTIPQAPAGYYLWTKTITTYTIVNSSGSYETDEKYSVSRIGEDGTSVEIKGNVDNYTALKAITGAQDGDGYIVTNASDDPDIGSKESLGILYTWISSTNSWTYCGQIRGPQGDQGIQGYSIVTSVTRDSFTNSQWSTYGTIGHSESWNDTFDIRNGCRVGDLFTIVGQATDTKDGHTLTYRSTTASGNLQGVCIAHQVTARGDKGETGATGATGAAGASRGYVYQLGTSTVPSTPSIGTTMPPSGWSSNILFPTTKYPYCYVSSYRYDGEKYVFDTPTQYSTVEGMTSILSDDGIDIITKNSSGNYIINIDAIQGDIDANNALTIAGFSINNQSFYNDSVSGTKTPGDAGSVWVSTGESSTKSIAGSSGTNTWAFAASNNFGVTTAGALYSVSGNIGGFKIADKSLTSGSYITNDYLGLFPGGTTTNIEVPTWVTSKVSNYPYSFERYSDFDTSNYYCYRSTNYNVASSYAVIKIIFTDEISSIKIGIRSYAETNYDYTIITTLNSTIIPTSTDSSYVNASTRGNQQSGHAESDYTFVTYSGVPRNGHIYVIYRKDNNLNVGDDRGYILLPKNNVGSSARVIQVGSNFYITNEGAICAQSGTLANLKIESESLSYVRNSSTSFDNVCFQLRAGKEDEFSLDSDPAEISVVSAFSMYSRNYFFPKWLDNLAYYGAIATKDGFSVYQNTHDGSLSSCFLSNIKIKDLQNIPTVVSHDGLSSATSQSGGSHYQIFASKVTGVGQDQWAELTILPNYFSKISCVVGTIGGFSSSESLSGYKGLCLTYISDDGKKAYVANDGDSSRVIYYIAVGIAKT